MKINHYLIAFALYFTVTTFQTAHAGLWDWCKMPISSVTSYIWSFCPITRGGLRAFEAEQKIATTATAQALIKQENDSKAAVDAQFKEINQKQAVAEKQINTALGTVLGLNKKVTEFKGELNKLEEDQKEGALKAHLALDDVTVKLALITVARAALASQVQEIALNTVNLDLTVGTMNTNMDAINADISEYKKQSQERDARIRKIRGLLQPKKADVAFGSHQATLITKDSGLVTSKY